MLASLIGVPQVQIRKSTMVVVSHTAMHTKWQTGPVRKQHEYQPMGSNSIRQLARCAKSLIISSPARHSPVWPCDRQDQTSVVWCQSGQWATWL